MSKKKLPLHLRMIRGGVGKSFCIKHYEWGIIKTKFPDMSRIKASAGQRTCRNLFREAVAYAKNVIADREKKAAWQQRLKRRNGVYNEAVKAYMLKDKLAKEREEMLARQLLRNALKNQASSLSGLNTATLICEKSHLHESQSGSSEVMNILKLAKIRQNCYSPT
ncbi:MAG: hypothetical protein ABI760_17165 [Ferruginibacter sp.]